MPESVANVNTETLELLERRIDSNVRSNFFKTVTIPIGGGGVFAIVLAVVMWVPAQIKTQLQSILNEEYVKTQITQSANQQIEPLVSARLDAIVGKRMEEIVKNYLDGNEGRQLLADEVKKVFGAEEVRTLVSQAATTYVKGDGQAVIRQTVLDQLRPTVEAAAQEVRENAEKLVINFEGDAVAKVADFEKGGPRELSKLIDRAEVIRKAKLPVILTQNVGIGPYYVKEAIQRWLTDFRAKFPEQFQHVAIFYGKTRGQGRFVALLKLDEFEQKLDASGELMDLLQMPADQISFKQTRQKFLDMFGQQAVRSVKLDGVIARVLRDQTIWLPDTKPQERIAVVDTANEDKFFGLTNRETLEASLFATN